MQFTVTVTDPDEAQRVIAALKKNPVPTYEDITSGEKVESRKEDRHQQGKFVGIFRHLPPSLRAKMRRIRKEQGLDAAVAFGKAANGTARRKTVKARLNRHRKTCKWCKRGYLAKRSNSNFCSKRCRDAEYNNSKRMKKSTAVYGLEKRPASMKPDNAEA